MKKNRFMIAASMLSFLIIILTACGNTSSEVSSRSENESANSNSIQSTDKELSAESKGQSVDVTAIEVEDKTIRQKEEYIEKLNNIEKELQNLPSGTTQIGMEEAEAEKYRIWDNALNEIYGVLRKQLSNSEFEQLREEQRNWINHRDETAKKKSLKFEGGSMESLEYVAWQKELTKERCYELVEGYMK